VKSHGFGTARWARGLTGADTISFIRGRNNIMLVIQNGRGSRWTRARQGSPEARLSARRAHAQIRKDRRRLAHGIATMRN
jgi:hypothetical protein